MHAVSPEYALETTRVVATTAFTVWNGMGTSVATCTKLFPNLPSLNGVLKWVMVINQSYQSNQWESDCISNNHR